jgi:hypothetical protein
LIFNPMQLPKRPAPYILVLLMAVLAALTLWMLRAVTAPEVRQAALQRNAAKSGQPPSQPAPVPVVPQKPGEPAR